MNWSLRKYLQDAHTDILAPPMRRHQVINMPHKDTKVLDVKCAELLMCNISFQQFFRPARCLPC